MKFFHHKGRYFPLTAMRKQLYFNRNIHLLGPAIIIIHNFVVSLPPTLLTIVPPNELSRLDTAIAQLIQHNSRIEKLLIEHIVD